MVPGVPGGSREANTAGKTAFDPKDLRLDLPRPGGFLVDEVGQRRHVLEFDKGLLPGQPSLRDPLLELVGVLRERFP